MEKEIDETLFKTRSARACIADGLHFYTGNFRRIFRATWLPILVFALISGIAESLLVVIYPLVVLALLLVFCLVYRFLLRPRLKFLAKVKTDFSTCMRHFGLLAVVAFGTLLICAVAWALTSVPAVILGIANIEAQKGILFGDPWGMPDYIKWLTMAVFALASFLQAYIYLAFFFPMRYAQGAAVASEDERRKALNTIQKAS
jgi:hypothetical protein